MSRYGNALYGASKYGEAPKLAYSVEPMAATVLSFNAVFLEWKTPTGNYTKFRILRHNSGFPATSEDGVVVFEQVSPNGTSLEGDLERGDILDGIENPDTPAILPGGPVYYSVFLFTSEKIWVRAGNITDVVPDDTGAFTKIVNLLPRVFTSKEMSPLGEVDTESPLVRFLDAFSFSYEQWETYIKLLRPGQSIAKSLYSTIPGEVLSLGLNPEPNLPVENQRRLIRDAIYLYANKGTKVGIEGYAEDLTSYIPTATVSSNLMLSVQDSTFYKGVGNWVEGTGATLEASTSQVPSTTSLQIDEVYTGKLTLSAAGEITLGETSPVTKGIPVKSETEYTISFKVKSPPSSGDVTISVTFYDRAGVAGTSYTSTAVSANNTWKLGSLTCTTDVDSAYASINISGNAAGEYYLDQICFQEGDTVLYEEARAINLLVEAKKINEIYNPSFEIDSATWSLNNATFSQNSDTPLDGYTGDFSGQFTSTAPWSITTDYSIPVMPGVYYTASAYMKSSDVAEVNISVSTYDKNDALLDTYSVTDPVTSEWGRMYLTFLIDTASTASYATLTIGSDDFGTVDMDMVQFERATKPTEYIDGSMPVEFGAIWKGTAHGSPTMLFPNKQVKMPRLAYTLDEWVPVGAFWRLLTPAGLEYNNISVIGA